MDPGGGRGSSGGVREQDGATGCREPFESGAKARALYPLDPLTSGELESAMNALKAAGRLAEGMLFPILVLREPPKADVPARREGDPVRREAFALVLDRKAKQMMSKPRRSLPGTR